MKQNKNYFKNSDMENIEKVHSADNSSDDEFHFGGLSKRDNEYEYDFTEQTNDEQTLNKLLIEENQVKTSRKSPKHSNSLSISNRSSNQSKVKRANPFSNRNSPGVGAGKEKTQ